MYSGTKTELEAIARETEATCIPSNFGQLLRDAVNIQLERMKIVQSHILWNELINFLDDPRIRLEINPVKNYKLKFIIILRKVLPCNKVIYIKRKRNKI